MEERRTTIILLYATVEQENEIKKLYETRMWKYENMVENNELGK